LGYTVLKANDAGRVRRSEMARQAERLLPHLNELFTSGYNKTQSLTLAGSTPAWNC
jgi:hypothetical protein